jgi:uncharacterized protein YjbJ (UPF0337 family)
MEKLIDKSTQAKCRNINISYLALDIYYQGVILMSFQEKAKAAAKNIEGKAQDAIGQVTGDDLDRLEGKAKQGEAKLRNAAADIKDKASEVAEGIKERVQATAQNVSGKVEEVMGNVTDDPAKTVSGQAKQAEAHMRNAKEDLR